MIIDLLLCARYWPGHRGKIMPSSGKPRSKGERKTRPQTKWFEVYNAKCYTHGDPSATSPLFLFSPASLWSATCNVAECHKYLNSSLLFNFSSNWSFWQDLCKVLGLPWAKMVFKIPDIQAVESESHFCSVSEFDLLSYLLIFSKLQFPHLLNNGNNNTQFWGLCETICEKHLMQN